MDKARDRMLLELSRMGKKGGRNRSRKLSKERIREIARMGAAARWGLKPKKDEAGEL